MSGGIGGPGVPGAPGGHAVDQLDSYLFAWSFEPGTIIKCSLPGGNGGKGGNGGNLYIYYTNPNELKHIDPNEFSFEAPGGQGGEAGNGGAAGGSGEPGKGGKPGDGGKGEENGKPGIGGQAGGPGKSGEPGEVGMPGKNGKLIAEATKIKISEDKFVLAALACIDEEKAKQLSKQLKR